MAKKDVSAARSAAARDTLVSLMTVFGNAQQALKNRMRDGQAGGLGPLHMRLLCLCADSPGITQQQLANLTCRDKGQVAHLIHALEKAGLLARSADPLDGRLWRMALTADGDAQADDFKALEASVAVELFSDLDEDDARQLARLSSQIVQGMNGP